MLDNKPEWYYSLNLPEERGREGNYHIMTTGCDCCASYDTYTPSEYKNLLNTIIYNLKEEVKRVEKCLPL